MRLPTSSGFVTSVRRIPRSDALTGLGLLLLAPLSLADAWFIPAWPDQAATAQGTMWNGLGFLAGLVLIGAMVYWMVSTTMPERTAFRLTRVMRARCWMGIGAAEIGLMAAYFITRSSLAWGYSSQRGYRFTVAPYVTPGWAWYLAVVASGLIVIGGVVKLGEPDLPASPRSVPGG